MAVNANLTRGTGIGTDKIAKPTARHRPWAFLGRSKWVTAGLIIFAAFVFLAIFGSTLAPDDPSAIGTPVLGPPSAAHLLGTTQTGQDVLSQLLIGAGPTLEIGFIAGGVATALSIIVGVSAGYFGGIAGELLSLLSNVFLVIPGLPLLIVLSSYLPHASTWVYALVLAIVGWAWGARVLRALTLSLRQQDFVQAAKAAGESNLRIIFFEILPNEMAVVATSFVYTVIGAISFYVALCFLGFGNINTWNWGTMLFYAQSNQAITSGAWWWYVPPGVAVALILLALVMLNFGIDEFINPRLRAAGISRRDLRATSRQQGITPVLANRRNALPATAGADTINSARRTK
jgi:peptide/nickel transport system permease protein